MNKLNISVVIAGVVVLAGAGLGAYFYWPTLAPMLGLGTAPPDTPGPAQPVAMAPLQPPAMAPAASEPEPPPPVPAADAPPLPPLAEADAVVNDALVDLAGRALVLGLMQTDGFVMRLVATVDNLPGKSAPARVWPVIPAPGRYVLQGDPDKAPQPTSADNAERYARLMQAVQTVEPAQAAALYRRLYPLFQQAWRELGHPRGEFHARLLQVLDHLLTTPVPASPPLLTLTEVKGPVPSTSPWLRYEFADPALQGLSAGQRALVRTGPEQQRRLMAWLGALRRQL
jgi:hypothetical protein